MKRTLLTILSVLLCAAMVLSFAACGEEEKPAADNNDTATTTTAAPVDDDEPADEVSIVGEWATDPMDVSNTLVENYAAQGMMVELDSFYITYTFGFNEDGTYTIGLDEDELRSQIPTLVEAIAVANGMTYDDMIASSGAADEDAAIDSFMELVKTGMVGALESIGELTYEFDGENLTMNIGEQSNTVVVELTETTLSFNNNGMDMVFTRQ